jgi:hypothetical protein
MTSFCQLAGASCGACCGLYNREDLSREAVREDLLRNTRSLAGVPRTPEAYRAAAARRAKQLPAPLYPTVRVCPLLGYLDAAESRVGCLGHPAATRGLDLRACGAYDAETCDAFRCPSHAFLGVEEAELAARAAGDFFLYGLVVTDAPFLRAVLDGLQELSGARVERAHLAHPPLRRALASLLALKEELPPGAEGHFGAFRAVRQQEGSRSGGGRSEEDGSPAERILDRLGGDADGLEAEVSRRLEACAAALTAAVAAQAHRG